ncbi:MAG: 50S ribosomal protein L28 [Candidatus Firestonebacteria bacterium]
MSRQCTICGKKPLTGNMVSHSKRHTKKRSMPNLQRVKTIIKGVHQHISVCTRCLRSGKVVKAIA